MVNGNREKKLKEIEIQQFIELGFVKINNVFSRSLASQAREILWNDLDADPHQTETWTDSVVWLGDYDQEPFCRAANSPVLHVVFNQLVGKGRWKPRSSLGMYPVRFPTREDTGDTGWHVDASFPGENSVPEDPFSWRVNVYARVLLMLFVFSDVEKKDAPTRIRSGSHLKVAKYLESAGEAGIALKDIDFSTTPGCSDVLATGEVGTVYLCHPFLVHAAQLNRGTHHRFFHKNPFTRNLVIHFILLKKLYD